MTHILSKRVSAGIVALMLIAPVTHARITRIVIDRIESPTFGGVSYERSGAYEKLTGRAYGELDPRDEANRNIVYINDAPVNADKRVAYSMDVLIIKPIDMRRGNRTVLYDVTNRGDVRALSVFDVGASTANDPSTEKDVGDGFLMKQGYTIVASGWQGDVPASGKRLTTQFPIAAGPDGKPITKLITAELIFTKPAFTASPGNEGDRVMRAHPAVRDRMNEARLLRRSSPLASRETVARSDWSFGKCPDGANPTPSDIDICYPAGFSSNYIYDLVYVAQDPIVMGIGFAATRDLIAFLRHERSGANPLIARGTNGEHEPLDYAIGFGRSQSGRYIKDLVYSGFNLDESKRVVFEGIMPLISGSRLTNTNIEFATPGRVPSPVNSYFYGGDQFPHTYATLTDPITGRTDGWLKCCSEQRACPKVIHMDSGTEAWGGRNSLVVTDAYGKNDVPVPDNVRLYYFSSTQHVPAVKPQTGICKNVNNPNPYRESMRALLVAMQNWISEGKTPPPSRFPRVSEGTLVAPLPAENFGFPRIPGVAYYGKGNDLFVKDTSVEPPQIVSSKRYSVLMPKVDADGNDIAGVRSVMVQAPLGTHTGWNQRRAGFMENEFCDLNGSYIPFANSAQERGSDPRASLQERYGSKDVYVLKVEAAAKQLVSDGFLLPDDAERLVREAKARDLGI